MHNFCIFITALMQFFFLWYEDHLILLSVSITDCRLRIKLLQPFVETILWLHRLTLSCLCLLHYSIEKKSPKFNLTCLTYLETLGSSQDFKINWCDVGLNGVWLRVSAVVMGLFICVLTKRYMDYLFEKFTSLSVAQAHLPLLLFLLLPLHLCKRAVTKWWFSVFYGCWWRKSYI